MAQKRKTDQTKLIARAALALAGKSGWGRLTPQAVARKARLKTETVTAVFPDKWALLKWVLKDISDKTDREVKSRLGDNWRDNLFELMMTRIDIAAPDKKAFASLPGAFRHEPKALPQFARIFWRTMAHMLKTAQVPGGPCHPAYVAAFGILYVSVVDTFLKDDTSDHAKTMAALDQRLGLFEQVVDFKVCPKN